MTYSTVNGLYWAALGLLIAFAAGDVALLIGWRLVVAARARRARRAYLGRVEERQGRALEDATWFLLRGHEARLAEQIADAKAVVRVVRDARESRLQGLALVTDEAI